MRWGRQRRQQQQKQEEDHPSSVFSLFRLLPLSWVSKLKPTKPKPESPNLSTPEQSTGACVPTAGGPGSQPLPLSKSDVVTSKKSRCSPAGYHPRAPPPRLSSASDHMSFSPAVLDRLVDRSHGEPDDAPRRHSCAGDDDGGGVRFPDVRGRGGAGRPFESARFNEGFTEPGFPLLSSRSCRADPERSGFRYDLARVVSDVRRCPPRTLDVSSETGGSDDDDRPGRRRRRRRSEAARRKPARARRSTENGHSLTEEDFFPHVKPAQKVFASGEWTEKGRRQVAAPEPAAGDEQQNGRKSFTGRVRQRSRVKVCSPRAAAARVKAAKEKERRKLEEEEEEEGKRRRRRRGRSLESFAVVKCSVDPQRDFRESMMEMIEKNGMGSPEEMEGLLACYLALNADEYHDVIVKVFRQLWMEINPGRPPSESEQGEAADGGFSVNRNVMI